MSVIAFLQARMSSSRLPGKVLLDLAGSPMLIQEINRLKRSKLIDDIVVVTSDTKSDDMIVDVCKSHNINYFRGSLDNVLDRFYHAYLKFRPDHIVRVTGDCPLIDWNIVDQVIEQHLEHSCDYTSNTLSPTYPDGLDVEVMTKDCLVKIKNKAVTMTELEHVTYYCYSHQEEFSLKNVKNISGDQSEYRLTVDTTEDFEVISRIYDALHKDKEAFILKDILVFLDRNPDIKKVNSYIARNEGLDISIQSELGHE